MNTRKKVLFLITKATWGGAQRYVWDLMAHIPKDRFEPILAYGERGALSEKLGCKAIEGYHLPALGRDIAVVSDIKSFFEIARVMRRIRPDVVHLNSSKAAALGALAGRILGVKRIVFTVHGWPFNEKRNELARVLMYLISWFTAFLSHEVIVVSRSDEAQGRNMRFVAKKVRYIPIGIEPPEFLSREKAREILAVESGLIIGTIAELTPNKGLLYAIEAISLLREQGVDASYAVIGEGEERIDLMERARDLRIADRVSLIGFLPDAAQYLKAFDIFVLPSVKEGMPYVLLEAAAAGLPIVATTVINPEVIERYEHIRAVPPGDPEALAAALLETMRERSEKELFPAQNDFSLSTMMRETVDLYA